MCFCRRVLDSLGIADCAQGCNPRAESAAVARRATLPQSDVRIPLQDSLWLGGTDGGDAGASRVKSGCGGRSRSECELVKLQFIELKGHFAEQIGKQQISEFERCAAGGVRTSAAGYGRQCELSGRDRLGGGGRISRT